MDKSMLPKPSPKEQDDTIDLFDPVEEPMESEPDSILSKDNSVNFDDTTLDYKPLEKTGMQKYEDMFFNLLRGKKGKTSKPKEKAGFLSRKVNPEPQKIVAASNGDRLMYSHVEDREEPVASLPLIRRKTLSETVLTQLKFPQISKSAAVVNGLALAVFAIGSILLYSQLPTRPTLVIGIILVSIAGNVLISSR